MTIHVNGKQYTVAEGTTVARLLEQMRIDPRLIAVARNEDVVHRGSYGDVVLNDGDQVEIIDIMAGG